MMKSSLSTLLIDLNAKLAGSVVASGIIKGAYLKAIDCIMLAGLVGSSEEEKADSTCGTI
jgi:hypothetical protein